MKAIERLTKVNTRKKFHLYHTDYERLMTRARRWGLISFRNRKNDPSNAYAWRNDNHESVSGHAKHFGHTPQKMLNKILDDFFGMLEKRKKHAG